MPARATPATAAGDVVAIRELVALSGERIRVPDAERLVHLQLRRFAGCPICNLHLRSFVERREEIVAAGICEVVVFHSTTKELFDHAADFPFPVVADPQRKLYAEFGVGTSPRAVLGPRAWWPTLRGLLRSFRAAIGGRETVPPIHPHGGRLGLPADFLIASDGRVLACKYGTHAYDQWSVDDLLSLVSTVEP